MLKDKKGNYMDSPIHAWFSLSYANYLVLPRSLMESMPYEWQVNMKRLLEEMDNSFECENSDYLVKLRGEKKKFVHDPLAEYRHPDVDYIKKIATKKVHGFD